MKKTLFAAVLGIACIGAFAFKASTKQLTYFYDNGSPTGQPVTFSTDPCTGNNNLCKQIINGAEQQLYIDQSLSTEAKRP